MSSPFIIGISGGASSGKTSICKTINDYLGEKNCTTIELESFYKESSRENNNHPLDIDFNQLSSALSCLKNNKPFTVQVFDVFQNNFNSFELIPTKIILIEGDMVLYDENVRSLLDLKIFVHTDSDERLARKVLKAGEKVKGLELVRIIENYRNAEKPAFEKFVFPTIKFADIIIPRGLNKPAMKLLNENLFQKVKLFKSY